MTVTTRHPEQHEAPGDEINLIDLWLVLVKRKWVVSAMVTLCIAAAVAAAFLPPRQYEVRTGIEIGSRSTDNEIIPVESTDAAKAKLENSYIPLVAQQFQAENETGSRYGVEVRAPRDSHLLILTSTATEDQTDEYKALHERIAGKLVQDHDHKMAVMKHKLETDLTRAQLRLSEFRDERTLAAKEKALQAELQLAEGDFERLTDPDVLAARRANLENKVQSAKLQLASLQDQAQVLKSRQKQLNTRAELLRDQTASLSAAISEAQAIRRDAIVEVTSETRAMAQLMIDNEIQQNSNRLGALEERLHVDLPNEQAELAKQLADLERQQAAQRDDIAEAEAQLARFEREHEIAVKEKAAVVPQLEAEYDKMLADHHRAIQEQERLVTELESRLANFTETRTVVEPMRSADSVGTSPAVILVLGAVVGVMLGVFAAFFAEFLGKVRQVQRARAAS